MNLTQHVAFTLLLLAGAVLLTPASSLASEGRGETDEEAAARLAALQAQLFGADLVVQAEVANVLSVGGKAVVVLEVSKTFRGATARTTIYAETAEEHAADLADRDAVWLLKATDEPRRFVLDGPASILAADRADEVANALDKVTYATLDELKVTVSLDKRRYKLDEPIRLTWSIENPSKNPIVVAEPDGWGAMLGLTVTKKPENIIEVGTNADAIEPDTHVAFPTLVAGGDTITGTASLLRLVAGHRGETDDPSGSFLQPGKYRIELVADTSALAKVPGVAMPKEAVLGSLSASAAFTVDDEPFSSLDEAKGLVAQFAHVEDLDAAVASDDAAVRVRAVAAIADYACPALLPLLEQMLRSPEVETRAAACSAITMWARHHAVVDARPFANLIDDLPLEADLSAIARAAADVAEAQHDTTMLPVLLRLLGADTVNQVSKRSVALSIAEITGLEIDETDLEKAEDLAKEWIEQHPAETAPPQDD